MIPGPTEVILCPHCEAPHRRATLASGNTFGATVWSDGKVDAPMLPDLPELSRCTECRKVFWIADGRPVAELPDGMGEAEGEPWQLVLKDPGKDRVGVMAELRKHLMMTATEARTAIDSTPRVLASGEYRWEARELHESLEKAGATIELRMLARREPGPKPALPPHWAEAPWVQDPTEADFLDAIDQRLWRDRDQHLFLRVRAWWAGNDPYRYEGEPWTPLASRESRVRDNFSSLFDLLSPAVEDECLMKAELARERGDFPTASELLARMRPAAEGLRRKVLERISHCCEARDSLLFSVQS